MTYKISNQIPPIYGKLQEVFKVNWEEGVVIAYGDTIYSKDPMPDHLIEHEKVHLAQQAKVGVEKWWEQYINNPHFRLAQELEATRAQVRHINQDPLMSKKEKKQLIEWIADKLCGPMYGRIITYFEALDAISK